MNRERAGFETDRRGCLRAAGSAPVGLAASGAGGGRGVPNPDAQGRNLADVEASVRWTQDVIARL